jgi:hypothetical protein
MFRFLKNRRQKHQDNTKGTHHQRIKEYEKLPKKLKELDDGYRAVIRELSKR